MSDVISLAGLNKPAVLAALYNGAKVQGLGILHFVPSDMSPRQAREQFGDYDAYYDYVHGRVVKVNLGKDEFDPWMYDRDNGEGAAQRAVDSIV